MVAVGGVVVASVFGCYGEIQERRVVFYTICFSSLYYFIGLYVKIRTEMLGVFINGLVK